MKKVNKASRNVGLHKTVLVARVKPGTLKHGSRILATNWRSSAERYLTTASLNKFLQYCQNKKGSHFALNGLIKFSQDEQEDLQRATFNL